MLILKKTEKLKLNKRVKKEFFFKFLLLFIKIVDLNSLKFFFKVDKKKISFLFTTGSKFKLVGHYFFYILNMVSNKKKFMDTLKLKGLGYKLKYFNVGFFKLFLGLNTLFYIHKISRVYIKIRGRRVFFSSHNYGLLKGIYFYFLKFLKKNQYTKQNRFFGLSHYIFLKKKLTLI